MQNPISDSRLDTTIFFLERYPNDTDLIYRSLALELDGSEAEARKLVAARYMEKS